MSIRGLDLPQWTPVVDPLTHTPGLFCGWTDTGKALVWWDGFGGAEEENPSDIDLGEES